MLQLKIPHATTKILRVASKTWCSQIKKEKYLKRKKERKQFPISSMTLGFLVGVVVFFFPGGTLALPAQIPWVSRAGFIV